MNIRPLTDRVVIKPIGADKVKGGIIIPDTAEKKHQALKGEVMAIGVGRDNKHGFYIMPTVNVGDLVLYDKYAGIETEDGDYIIMRDSDILAVLEGEKND